MTRRRSSSPSAEHRRWAALAVLCLGALLIVLDLTIVNVALPSIGKELHFSPSGLVWVMNAYLLTYGGFLLLAGRLGDRHRRRRLFLIGLVVFSLASLACGLAPSGPLLVGARAVQGLGAALVDALSLSLIVSLFTEPAARARAMGFYGFVNAGGGSLGVLAGGVLTSAFGWHAVFLVAVPIGAATFALTLWLVDEPALPRQQPRLDVAGAVAITLALLVAVWAIVGANAAGWLSARTLVSLAAAALLLAVFIGIEARSASPLVPLGIFRLRNVVTANLVAVLWSAGMFAWNFITSLYMQEVLHYEPLQVGLAFLPGNAFMAVCSIGLSARLVDRFGTAWPMAAGLLASAAGLALLARVPLEASYAIDLLPGMLLLGLGGGIAFNPMLLAAMNQMKKSEAGLASGLVNTSFMMGGALALAVLASVAEARSGVTAGGVGSGASPAALAAGFRAALLMGAGGTLAAAVLGASLLGRR
jgi:EmrB/QacA subfamily drug resistance transporter